MRGARSWSESTRGGIGLLGAGAQADEVESFLPAPVVRFRAVQADYLAGSPAGTVDIAAPPPEFLTVPVVAAVGAPGLRRSLVDDWAGTDYARVVSEAAWVHATVEIGEGVVVAPGAVLSLDAVIGSHSLIGIGASVSHHTLLGRFVTLSPGVTVAGRCTFGDGVFLGVGAVVSNEVSIASGAVIGAGAVVVDSIDEPGVYIGVPARKIRSTDGWLNDL